MSDSVGSICIKNDLKDTNYVCACQACAKEKK